MALSLLCQRIIVKKWAEGVRRQYWASGGCFYFGIRDGFGIFLLISLLDCSFSVEFGFSGGFGYVF